MVKCLKRRRLNRCLLAIIVKCLGGDYKDGNPFAEWADPFIGWRMGIAPVVLGALVIAGGVALYRQGIDFDTFLNYFALGLLIFVIITLFYGIIAIHDVPYEIARGATIRTKMRFMQQGG